MMAWTKELRWNEISHAAVILQQAGLINVVPDFGKTSMLRLNERLNASPNIRKRKTGTAQSSPTFYKAHYEED